MSKHEVSVVVLNDISPHPNADALDLVKIFGYTCCVRKDSFKVGDLAAYIEPDMLAPTTRPEFEFLGRGDGQMVRIKVKRLRGIYSQGLLIPAPEGSKEGDNVIEQLGIVRYEPQMLSYRPRAGGGTNARAEKPPEMNSPSYDLENFRKYGQTIPLGEPVWISEKIHGCSARFLFDGEKMHFGSRNEWKKPEPGNNPWFVCSQQNPWIEELCRANPNMMFYGEVYGWVQDLRYGAQQNELKFKIFDAWNGTRYLDYQSVVALLTVNNVFQHFVPVLWEGEYNYKIVEDLAEGRSTLAEHIREGVVVKPKREMWDERIGRVALKCVGNQYLERAK